MDRRSGLRFAAVAVALIALGFVFWMNRHPKPRHLDLPPGTIYYKGPMKSKGGNTSGVDTLNPDILGDEP